MLFCGNYSEKHYDDGNINPQKTEKFISCLRKENNLTQKDLAYKLGVCDKAVSKWEMGRCYPDIKIFGTLSQFLGVTVNDLLSSEKQKLPAVIRRRTATCSVL